MRPLQELDEAFNTLDLVNSPDMDAFMKAIMFMKKKPAQNLRGELNNLGNCILDACYITTECDNINLHFHTAFFNKTIVIDVHPNELKDSLAAEIME